MMTWSPDMSHVMIAVCKWCGDTATVTYPPVLTEEEEAYLSWDGHDEEAYCSCGCETRKFRMFPDGALAVGDDQ